MSSDNSDIECVYEKNTSNESEVILSSDESDNEDLPDGAECLRRCKEFASVTGTDQALAMFYLQGTKWDLEVIQKPYIIFIFVLIHISVLNFLL